MTELPGQRARAVPGAEADPTVPPPADDFQARPVPDAARNAGGMGRFAGMVLGLTGIWQAVAGLVALTEPTHLSTARLPVHVSYATWGWVHVLLGALAIVAGFGVIAGNRLASVVAVVLAVVSAVVNLVFMKADPFSAFMIIALDVLVIWGVTAQAPTPRPAP